MIQHYIFANRGEKTTSIGASTLDGKTQVPLKDVNEAFAAHSLIEWRLNVLVGKLLTQCDAVFSDPIQRKAFKDQIRMHFADEFAFFGDMLMKGVITDSLKRIEEMSDAEFSAWTEENPPVDIDEVIAPGQ